ncbi:alpha/beta fold hydrolase [Amycolatopsis sp. 195334CR]|uniref:alpha/beta fold hydrolase n=1 Tax=Amycolatopsis sp. 195334CR TaxID=2814588 RepID=UPI001A8EEFC8|nr:alpha/beta hydrolase [Amycolatopsis sp. 195334CR]MBN6040432.1 alpha/beta hydrolase [Amycolatopsis sp. 195334CR]
MVSPVNRRTALRGAAALGAVPLAGAALTRTASAAPATGSEGVPGSRLRLSTGVTVHYVDRGAGRPLVFVPGWMATTEFFGHQLTHFAGTHRVLSYDPRSQGKSEKTAQGNNFTTRGRDLDAFLRALDLTGAVLAGFSYGSYDVFAYLRDFGFDRVAGVVVLDQPPKSWAAAGDPSWSESPLVPAGLPAIMRAAIDDRTAFWTEQVKIMLAKPPSTPDTDPEVAWAVRQGLLMPQDPAIAMLGDGMASDFSAVATETAATVPTLVYSRTDWLPTAQAWVSEHMPAADFAEMPTHLGFHIAPGPFNDRLAAFLAALG